MKFLFPTLQEEGIRGSIDLPDRISLRRPLATVLRLKLLPGKFSRKEIGRLFVDFHDNDLQERLRIAKNGGWLVDIVERLGDVYFDEEIDDDKVWRTLSRFLDEEGCSVSPGNLNDFRGIARVISNAFFSLVARNTAFKKTARSLFDQMIARNERCLPAHLLREHIHAHGLYGYKRRGNERAFLTPEETFEAINEMARMDKEELMSGTFSPWVSAGTALF